MRALRIDWRVEAVARPAVPAPAPRRDRDRRRPARRLARRAAPVGRRAMGPRRRRRGLRARLRRPRRRRHARAALRGRHVVPGRPAGPRRGRRRRRAVGPRARGDPERRRPAAARGRGVRRLPRRPGGGRARRRSRSGSSSARPTARSPTRTSPSGTRRSSAPCASRSEASCVPRVAVLGASGYAGAVAAMLVHRHPFFELAHVTARSEAGARLDDIHPRTRVPMELESWDADVQSDVDAALVCWPHRVAAPAVAELRERGVRVVDLSADFRLRDRGIYEDWYGEHGAPELFGQGVYGLPELHRAEIAGADLVANPGCYPTAALLALAPLARAGLIGDVVIDAKSGVSGAGREPTSTTHFISRRREHDALQGRAPSPHARDRAGARGPGRAGHDHVHPAPGPARPGRARVLLRHGRARARRGRGAGRLRRGVRARAVGGAAARAARRAGGARDQLLPRVRALRRAHGPDPGVRLDRQPLEGRRARRRCRT